MPSAAATWRRAKKKSGTAVQKAHQVLRVKGFLAVKKGTPLYKKAKEIYGQCTTVANDA